MLISVDFVRRAPGIRQGPAHGCCVLQIGWTPGEDWIIICRSIVYPDDKKSLYVETRRVDV